MSGNRASSDFSGTLVPGGSYSKDITFIVDGLAFGTLINRSEITSDDGFDFDSNPKNWTGPGVEDDDDSDYIVVAKPINPGGTYVPPSPPPTPPTECMWDSCYPSTPPEIIKKVIKRVFTEIRDTIFPQAQNVLPLILPSTWAGDE